MATILQINFTNDISEEELAERTSLDGARAIAAVPGLHWKVWLRDPETRTSGGIYLFENREAVEAYLAGPIVAAIRANPGYTSLTIKQFDVREEVSAITNAPVPGLVAV